MLMNLGCRKSEKRAYASGSGQARWRVILAAILFGFVLAAGPGSAGDSQPLPVVVSILPQKYFVEKIGRDAVTVSVMVPPGSNPEYYEPKPRQMSELARARVYFALGVPFEKAWMKKMQATSPAMMVVQTDAKIAKISMDGRHSHEMGQAGHDPHGETDPHVWLAPGPVKVQAAAIRDGLVRAHPAGAARYEANYNLFVQEIDELDAELKGLLAEKSGSEFLVFHPAWGYFAQAYGLKQVAIEAEGKEPKPAQLQAAIARARQKGIRTIFVQPQHSTKTAATIAKALGGEVVPADPLAGDWPGNLREVARKFKASAR
jgi:zinc transport system substrate-binding protein